VTPNNVFISLDFSIISFTFIHSTTSSSPSSRESSFGFIESDFSLALKKKRFSVVYPGETVKFLIAADKPSYISIQGIDAEGSVFWLPIKNNFLEADIPRNFPDNDEIEYKVLDGVFGAERIYIYASSTPEGLPKQNQYTKYRSNMLSDTARGLVAVKKQQAKDTAIGVFCITYTIMPGKRED